MNRVGPFGATILLIAVLSVHAYAQDAVVNQAVQSVGAAQTEVNEFGTSCSTCQAEKQASRQPGCNRFYSSLYKSPQVDVVFALGYGDFGDDPHANWSDDEYADFITEITRPCRSERDQACGFTPEEDDGTRFSKTIIFQGNPKTIRLRAVKGSASDQSQQKEQSRLAEQTFVEALKSADVVFYDGHSREGGGPDFKPAKRKPNQHIDYDWYRANKPGLGVMKKALAASKPGKPKVIGMFSCLSMQHYLDSLKANAKSSKYILTNRLAKVSEGIESIISSLNGLMTFQCGADLRKKRPNDSLEYLGFD